MTYDDIRDSLTTVGGLIGVAGLAERWGVSAARVHQYAAMEDFPARVRIEGVDVKAYIADEVDEWKTEREAIFAR